MKIEKLKAKLINEYNNYKKNGDNDKEAYEKLVRSVDDLYRTLQYPSDKSIKPMSYEEVKSLINFVIKNLGNWVNAPKIICNNALPKVTYNYPNENGNNPFDIKCDDKYFIDASGFTYSYPKYLSTDEIYRSDAICSKIPMGYKTILTYEKKLFIKNGHILKSFEEIKEAPDGKKYSIISTSECFYNEFYSCYIDLSNINKEDYSQVKNIALSLSQNDQAGIYLIVKNNDNLNWH